MSPAPWMWALTYGIPYTIAYLVHFEHTRPLRVALFPLGILAVARFGMTINIGNEPLWAIPFLETATKWNIIGASYYAFMAHPPQYPPLPVEPFWAKLRRTTAFRAFNLLIDANQRLSLQPITRPHVPYLRAVSRRFGAFLFHAMVVEVVTFPAYYLIDPSHPTLGVDTLLGSAFWTFSAGVTMYQGTAMICELFAFVTIALGIYTDEEFPAKWWHNPLASTSMTELWGKRYHRFMRDPYIRFASPLAYIGAPRAVYILGIFALSGVYHTLFFYPMTGSLEWYPQMTFWLGCGTVCVLERAFYKATGRKVEGWWGRIWVLACFWLVSGPFIKAEVAHGTQARSGKMAREVGGKDRLLPSLLHALGLPGPIDWNDSGRLT